MLQLLQQALEGREAADVAWRRADGRFVDPFRPQIEPDGFDNPQAVAQERRRHLGFVRQVMEGCDVFIFTLGLTEAWRSREDGSVYPLAPGVAGGEFDAGRHEFVNFGVDEVERGLDRFLARLKVVNPKLRVLLTVSPVPLIATYEDRHVAVSTAYSKSVLRVVADRVCRDRAWVDYFPSYEIFTASFSSDLYYAADRREVTSIGVAHAMRSFVRNYAR